MSWNWILVVAAIYLLFDAPAIFIPLPSWVTWISTPLSMVIGAMLLAKNIETKHFKHGFFAGLLGFLASGLLQTTFFETYLKNNPQEAGLPEGFSNPWLLFALLAVLFGPLMGAIQGGLTVAAARLQARRTPHDTRTGTA